MTDLQANIAEAHPKLILASRVLRTPVYTIDADRLGHVDDISIDRVSGQCIYGIMSFGGVFGIGEKYHPLPWDVLQYDPEVGGFELMMTREELQHAPHYTRAEMEKLGGARHHARDAEVSDFYATYGVLR
ncbi:PRC-barrel domain containing protein [Altererythrobacter soli]|uniref:PRC-barrel domain containing protein n=1 Tax=Croceibacterium soli TaxID=1739690 RepID=A0A6I4UPA0_9SPHN|nr:PRC-barrel domain-containing protein [Croceibacterium soli]MXP40592.1 PRC-barrel domain containing protein [Croceibacterium soli]